MHLWRRKQPPPRLNDDDDGASQRPMPYLDLLCAEECITDPRKATWDTSWRRELCHDQCREGNQHPLRPMEV